MNGPHPSGVPIFSAAILAGGHGARLGTIDKRTLVIDDVSILERQLSVIREVTPHVLIVDREPRPAHSRDVPVVVDCVAGAGALGGLYTALVMAPTEQVLVIACDMPFLHAGFLSHLASRGEDVEAAMPRDAYGRHPLCASYHRGVAGRLRAYLDRGGRRVLDAVAHLEVREIGPDELAPFDPDGTLLLNVNTPHDYENAVHKAMPLRRLQRTAE